MNLFITSLVFVATLASMVAGDCLDSYYHKRCLKKNEMKGFEMYFVGGDPCFLNNNQRWCFVDNQGNMGQCSCSNPDCGCGDPGPEPPKCDNSMVPTSFPTHCGQGWGSDNTMCIYSGMGYCGQVCAHGLTQAEKQQVLDKHNELRRKVAKGEENIGYQPPATNMNKLVWDDQLAESAQRWTDQCIDGHDNNRKVPEFAYVGQNYAMSGFSSNTADKNLDSFLMMWYDEVKDLKSGVDRFTMGYPNTGPVGHYTQLVWAETKKVGCGFIQNFDGQWYNKVMICNYGKGGNWDGQPIYIKGEPGSACANYDDGLCA